MLPTLHMDIWSVRCSRSIPQQQQRGVCLPHKAPVVAVGSRLQCIQCPAEVPQRQHGEH